MAKLKLDLEAAEPPGSEVVYAEVSSTATCDSVGHVQTCNSHLTQERGLPTRASQARKVSTRSPQPNRLLPGWGLHMRLW
jgi:hypothetical protein